VFLLSRGLPLLLELGLTIFCLIDCVQTPETAARNLPKWAWIVLILVFPLFGSIAWLVAGRPTAAERAAADRAGTRTAGYPAYEQPRRTGPTAPDDDPEFLRAIGQVNTEHEQTLKRWEDDLKRREDELKRRDQDPPAG
jgi:hypothetical protein